MVMTMTFGEFISQLFTNLPFALTVLLTLGVILVNGWTDAPNAIATCVSTRAMTPRNAIIMAAIFNFLGVFVMTAISSQVATTIYKMVNFQSHGTNDAMIALCAALFAIVLWATAAWYFGIPTSESHALIAGISGAAIALYNGVDGINGQEWIKVIYGLVLSTFLGFFLGFACVKLVELIFKRANRKKVSPVFNSAQIGSAAAMAFMHGAQDGQKFMGVFLMGAFLAQGQQGTNFDIPLWLMILCSVVMGVGTSIGGYRIIKSVGMDMVKLEKYQGFSADLAASICLLISSLFGIPVSTTHTKTTAIMGVGAAKRLSSVNWSVVKNMVLTWVLTFPGCGIIGFIMAKLFMYWFC